MASPLPRQAVLSTQVSNSRYFFLGLAAQRRRGLLPAYGGFEQCNPDYVVQREAPGFAVLELVVGGRGTVQLNGQTTPLRAGMLYYYDPGTRLEIRADPAQPLAKYFVCFHGRSANPRLAAAGLRPGGIVRLALFAEAQHVFEELIREGGHHRATAGRICATLAEVLVLKIEELAGLSVSPGRAAEETFLRCKGTIEAQTARLGTLTDMTRAVGVGPTHLSRLFRRYQGLSPYQYLLRRKMALAAEALMNPATLVKEAAAQVGFTDPFHFSRCFKQVHRVAPREFQRSLKHV
ncbi:MAG TPA: AraC family transcriptional regulator [Lacunisphaera sp.]|nr:AraC family transcriptional regulator [Lacunisphaera sp.]